MPEGISFSAWLASLDDGALTELLGVRSEALARPPRTFHDLAALLGNPVSVGEALRQLDRSAVQLAGVLGTLGPSTQAQVTKALARSGEVPPGHVERALDRLCRAGLAWSDAGGRWHVPQALVGMAGGLCGFGPPVLATAERTQFFLLSAALEALGLPPARSARDAVFALSAWARDETAVARTVAAAPRSVRTVLERIAVDGPVADLDDEVARWLSERCLLVHAGPGLSTVPAELVAFARGKRVVGAVRTEPGPAVPSPADPEPLLAAGAAMRTLLEILDRVTLKPLQSGGIGVQEQRRLAKALGVEQDVVRRLLHLAGDAGLVSTGGKPGFVTAEGAAWLEQDEVPAAAQLVVAAIEAGRSAGDESSPLWGIAWGRSRPSLRLVLASLVEHPDRPPLEWLSWRWYGVSEEQLRTDVVELAWLGLLTPTGVHPWAAPLVAGDLAGAVEVIQASLPAEQDDVVIQADGTAVVAGRPSRALRRLLDGVARRESERTWRIEAGCIRAAYDAGADAATLLAQLRSHSRHAVPQVIERLVHDVAAQHGRIVVVPATTLLRVEDEPLAITLLRDRRLKALGLSEVQPGLLTSPKKHGEVLAALRVAGYAPAGPPEPQRRRPAGSRATARTYQVPSANPADVVQALRRAPHAAELATVHHLPAPAYAMQARFDHLPVDQRLLLARALTDGRPVEIDYVDSGGRQTTRVVEALEDVGWLLEGWCRLREAERNFAPDGILAVRSPG